MTITEEIYLEIGDEVRLQISAENDHFTELDEDFIIADDTVHKKNIDIQDNGEPLQNEYE